MLQTVYILHKTNPIKIACNIHDNIGIFTREAEALKRALSAKRRGVHKDALG